MSSVCKSCGLGYRRGLSIVPSVGEARVQHQSAADNPEHRVEVLTENPQHIGGIGERRSIFLAGDERPARVTHANIAIALEVFAPAVDRYMQTAHRRPAERRPVLRVARIRLLEQGERLQNSSLAEGQNSGCARVGTDRKLSDRWSAFGLHDGSRLPAAPAR
jgi:hypothetical protein